MPDKKITDLVDGGALQPTDEFVVARAGDNFKIDGAEVVSAVTKHDVTLDGNTAGALALVSSGTLSLAGGNNITLSQAGNAVTISGAATSAQTVQTQNVVDLTLDGNTAGALALVSSGTATLVGGNNITLSQAGNAITISGANAAGAQTAISGLANSETTYTSGTVSLSELGALTIRSSAGQIFQFEVPATSSISATGIVSVSTNGSTISIGASQSVQPETQTFIAGISASNTLYTSGNVRLTGVGGGVTVSSNTGQRVDISVAAQSVQPETQTFIAGISASDTLYTSGNVRISGSNAATVKSGTGQLVVIDVPVQSTQVETQTFVGGIAGSNTTYTSGTALFTGVGGGVTVSSNTGQRIDISVAAPVAQTNQSGNVYASSNTFGTSSGTYDARSISIAGRGAVSVAASNSGWIVSAPAQTNQAGSVYAISNTSGTSSGTYDARTLSIAGAGIVTVAASNSGWRIDATTAAQTNQSGNVYASSNTFGTSSGTYDARSISIAGRGAVSVAASNSGWIISAPAQSVQPETQTFIAGISASDTLYTSGNVRITGVGGGVTVSSNTGQRVDISVAAQSVQPETQTFIAGVSASDTLYTSGNVRITGVGGGITVSSNTGQRVDLSVAAQSVQTQGVPALGASTGGNTAGDTQVSSGTRLVFVGSNNITLSQGTAANATTITISGPTVAGAQTGISGIANSQTTYTSGTVSLSELGAVTIRSTTGNQFQISVNAQSVQPETQTFIAGVSASDTLYTSGNVRITGVGGGVTVSSNTGQRVDISVAAPVAQTNQSGNVYASSNTFGTSSGTYDARSISIARRGAVSVAASNSGWIISAPAQTAQSGISGIANSQTTYTTGTVSLSELGAITIRSTTGNQYQFSVNSQTAQTQSNIQALYDGANSISTGTVRLTDANGVTFSINAQTLSASVNQSISMFAVSNTTQSTSGTAHKSALSFAGAGVASVGVTGGSVIVSVPAGGGAGFSAGVSTGGNTAGATGMTGTQLVLVGTNNISLSQTTGANGATISISGVDKFSAGISTGGNTAGDTGVTGTRLVFVGDSPISLSQVTGAAGATLSIDAPATSSLSGTGGIQISTNGSTISVGYGANQPDWENFAMGNAQLATHVSAISKTPIYWIDNIDGNLTAKSLALKISMVTASQPLSVSVHLGVYTHVNSTSAARLASHSEAFVVSSASSVSLSGVRALIMTGIGTHATLSTISGGVYVLGLMFSATATNAMNFSLYGAGSAGGPLGGLYPGTNNLSTGTSQGVQALAGRGSTTVNAMPANIQASEIVNYGQGASMQLHPWIYIRS